MEKDNKLYAEYLYYLENKENLLLEYSNKIIVIKNQKIIGSFSSYQEAITETMKNHQLGTFLVKNCSTNDDEDESQMFYSRVGEFHAAI